MNVLFYSNVLEYTKGEKSYTACNSASVRELIIELGEHYGDRLKEFLLGDSNCIFLVNSTGLMKTGGLDTKLKQGDKIEILPFADAG